MSQQPFEMMLGFMHLQSIVPLQLLEVVLGVMPVKSLEVMLGIMPQESLEVM